MTAEAWQYNTGKLATARWLPRSDVAAIVCGTWDESVSRLSLWQYTASMDETAPVEFVRRSQIVSPGSVSAIAPLVGGNYFAATSDSGFVSLVTVGGEGDLVSLGALQAHRGPATAVALFGASSTAVSVGEDGAAVLLDLEHMAVSARVADADLGTISDVATTAGSAFWTLGSELRRWDSRSQTMTLALRMAGASSVFTSCAPHPSQPDILLTGDAGGLVAVWDARESSAPVARVQAHKAAVSDVAFHSVPDNAFTCSSDGSVMVWDFNAANDRSRVSFAFCDEPNMSVRQLVDAAMPINTVDMSEDHRILVAATDTGLVSIRGIDVR
eukprot:c469_g1_i2.p1 GENE.c469_g1_i2~~c469_g1_i2.p1  ORF type:complete len:344 (+),score=35.92 c469_g1_i2:49-1032(+)